MASSRGDIVMVRFAKDLVACLLPAAGSVRPGRAGPDYYRLPRRLEAERAALRPAFRRLAC
jgi:hypothetical protein